MIDIFDVIIIIIAYTIFGVLLLLIYLPYKKWLIKSGRFTDKIKRRLKVILILLIILYAVFLYWMQDYGRTPSNIRLETISDVHLPPNFRVLKDEYQDMMQDYCIIYTIQLDKSAISKLIKSIKISKYYNKNAFHNGIREYPAYISVGWTRAFWSKSTRGYDFHLEPRGLSCDIELDTITGVLKYEECQD